MFCLVCEEEIMGYYLEKEKKKDEICYIIKQMKI
jgi:hypothetical protein